MSAVGDRGSAFRGGRECAPRVLSPLSRVEDVEPLVRAGADEFYLGYLTPACSRANKREHSQASFVDPHELSRALEAATSCGRDVYLAVNGQPGSHDLGAERAYLRDIAAFGVRGLIVQDVAMLMLVADELPDASVVLSSLAQLWNVEAVALFLERFPQITRVVCPRDLMADEVGGIATAFPNVGIEAFVLNEWCYNTDGMCSATHYFGEVRPVPYVCRREDRYVPCGGGEAVHGGGLQSLVASRSSCHVCAIFDLVRQPNLAAFKIVGRGKPLTLVERSTRFVSRARDYAGTAVSRPAFILELQQLYQGIFERRCPIGSCPGAS